MAAGAPGFIWTAGAYLAARRRAAGLSIDDVAAAIRTVPHALNERDRRLWLASIEADLVPVPEDIAEWRELFPFDPLLVEVLSENMRRPDTLILPPICRRCACSDFDPCIAGREQPCARLGTQSLCTACALSAPPEIIVQEPSNGR